MACGVRAVSKRPAGDDCQGEQVQASSPSTQVETSSPLTRRVRRRIIPATPTGDGDGALETRPIGKWHSEPVLGGDGKKIVGLIFRSDETIRKVKVADRKTQKAVEKPVYRVWLSDGIAIIEMNFWSDLAVRVHNELLVRSPEMDGVEPVVMVVQKFTVRGDDRKQLMPYKRLTAADNADMDIRLATGPEKEEFRSATMDRTLYLSTYDRLQEMGPFGCNIIGVVTESSGVYASASGALMLSFALVSLQNEKVQCVAFGINADVGLLADGNSVAILNAQSRPGLRGQRSRLWLYDEAVVAVLAAQQALPSMPPSYVLLSFAP